MAGIYIILEEMPNTRVVLDLHGTRDGPPGASFFIIKRIKTRFINRKGTIKIQAFQTPISNAGIIDIIHQHIGYTGSV